MLRLPSSPSEVLYKLRHLQVLLSRGVLLLPSCFLLRPTRPLRSSILCSAPSGLTLVRSRPPSISSRRSLQFLRSPLRRLRCGRTSVLLFSLLFPRRDERCYSIPTSLRSPSHSERRGVANTRSRRLRRHLRSSSRTLLSLLPFRTRRIHTLPRARTSGPTCTPLLSRVFLRGGARCRTLLLRPLSSNSYVVKRVGAKLRIPLRTSSSALMLHLPGVRPSICARSTCQSALLLRSPSTILPRRVRPLSSIFRLSLRIGVGAVLCGPIFF